MLVLYRRTRQSVMVGPDIEVVVLGIEDDGSVRLGFDAPDDVVIDRREIFDSKQREEQENAS